MQQARPRLTLARRLNEIAVVVFFAAAAGAALALAVAANWMRTGKPLVFSTSRIAAARSLQSRRPSKSSPLEERATKWNWGMGAGG